MALHPFAALRRLVAQIANGGPVVQIPVPVGPLIVRVARMFAKTESAMDSKPIEPEQHGRFTAGNAAPFGSLTFVSAH